MISDKGYQRVSYEEIKSAITADAQDRFGADIATDDKSTFGTLINFVANIYNEIEQKMEESYNSAFVSSASGVSLDRLANNFGITRKLDNYASVYISFEGKPGYTVKVNTGYRNSDGLIFTLPNDVLLDSDGKGKAICYASSTGYKYNIAQGSVMEQVQPVGDVYKVTTLETANGGSDKETDKELRERVNYAARGLNSSTYNGVVSAIKSIPGVTMVRIIENHSDTADKYGNPPYTIHIYVTGGNDNSVAGAIFNSIAIGINTYGGVNIDVTDNAGNKHNIMFDRPSEILVNGKITLTVDEKFPADGVQQVKEQILDYISTLNMGDTVRYSYIYKYIYDNVVGVQVADVLIGKSKDSLATQDIKINPFEIAKYDGDKVEVNVQNG